MKNKIITALKHLNDNLSFYVILIWMLFIPVSAYIISNHVCMFEYSNVHIFLCIILAYTYIWKLIKSKFSINIYDVLIYISIELCLLSTIFASDYNLALYGASRENGSITLMVYFLMFLNVIRFNNKNQIKILIGVLLCISVVNVIYGSLQLFVDSQYISYFYKPYMAKALCLNPNFFGALMSLVLPITIACFVVSKKNLILWLILSLIFLAGLIFAQSTGPLVGVVIALLFFLLIILIRNRKWLKKFILIVCVLIMAFIGIDKECRYYYQKKEYDIDERYTIVGGISDIYKFVGKYVFGMEFEVKEDIGNGRMKIWKTALPLLKEYPWVGCGTDNFSKVFDQFKPGVTFIEAHNIYLNYAINNGIPAAIIFIGGLILVFTQGLRIKNDLVLALLIGFVSYCVQAFFNISTIQVSTLFYIFTSLIVALINIDKYIKTYDCVLYGYYGYKNKGDDFVLKQIITNLLKERSSLKICALVGKNYDRSDMVSGVCYKKRNLLNVYKYSKYSDYFITGGGSLLQDKTSEKSFLYYLLVLKLVKFNKKKIIMYGNGIGPLKSKNIERLKNAKLPISYATFRDKESCKIFEKIYPKVSSRVTSDELLTYNVNLQNSRNEKYICLCLKNENYDKLQVLFKYVDDYCLSNHLELKIIIMDELKDIRQVDRLILNVQSKVSVSVYRDIDSILTLLYNSEGVISMRLHLLILASMTGIKPIAIASNDNKINEFMEMIKSEKYLLNINDIEESDLVKLLSNKEIINIDELIVKAKINAKLVIDAMEE